MLKRISIVIASLLSIIVVHAQTSPVQKALIEKYTSCGCGACGNASLILEDIAADYPNSIPVYFHVGNFDAMVLDNWNEVFGFYAGGTPMATVNRSGSAIGTSSWESATLSALAESPTVGISFDEVNYDASSREISATIRASFVDTIVGDIRFNMYVLEDSVTGEGGLYAQNNYYDDVMGHPHYGLGFQMFGFVHNHVLRHCAGGFWGTEAIIPDTVFPGEEFTMTYTWSHPDSFKALDMQLVGMVQLYDPGANKTLRPILNAEVVDLDIAINLDPRPDPSFEVQVYPNPARDNVSILFDLPAADNFQIRIADLNGRVVREEMNGWLNKGIHTHSMDLSDLPKGLYVIRIEGDQQLESHTLLIR